MSFTFVKALVIFVILNGLLSVSYSTKAETLRLVGEVYPPGTNADGSGQQFEIVKAVFEALGFQVNIEVYPYKRAIKLVEIGQADMMVGMLKDSDLQLNYSYYPHDVDNLLAIYPRVSKTQWQGSSSLKNKHLTMLLGLSEPFKKSLPNYEFQVSEVNSHPQALKKLFYGRTDFIIDSEGTFLLLYEQRHRDNLYTQLVGAIEIYAAFSKSDRGKKAKILWDEKFEQFIQTKAAEKIYQKWGMDREYWVTQQFIIDKLENSRVNEIKK